MSAITISIRELHARTGHFVRKSAEMPVIITDNGKPVAEIQRIASVSKAKRNAKDPDYWANRKLRPRFKKLQEVGALRLKPGDKPMDEILDELRGDRPL